jgi:dienelactone hydrolase
VVELQVGEQRERSELSVYVPPGYDPSTAAPLLLAAHGTGGRGRDELAMWRAAADKLSMLVLAPSEAGANDGYAFTERERLAALAALRWVRRRFHVDENRIFATGVSRGGHLAWDLALRFPDRFAAIAPMIGSPRLNIAAGQNNARYLENVVHLPIRDLQGSRDDPRLLFNLRLVFARLRELGAGDAELIEFEQLGHAFDATAVDWAGFFGGAVRDPRRSRVVRASAAPNEGRAFWVEILSPDRSVQDTFRLQVQEKEWNALDDDGKRRFMQDEADRRTARLEVEQLAPGRFSAKSRGVRKLRLLLTADMTGNSGAVEVTLDGKARRKTARPDVRVLLLEFVERFDRAFLPVAEVTIP